MSHELIKQKISLCQESLAELEKIFPAAYDGLFSDPLVLPAIERYFQLIVDSAVDCNTLMLESLDVKRPETYFGTFTTLGERSIIPAELADSLASSVGLRNALVHRYEEIDRRRMHQSMKKFILLYRNYLTIIAPQYL